MTDSNDTLVDAPLGLLPNGQPRQRKLRDTSAQTRKVGAQVRGTVLMPWMAAYAEWLILECLQPPTRTERFAKARFLARAAVTNRHLYLLEERPDFLDYCDQLRTGPLEAARTKFMQALPKYIDRHAEALDLATDARDYNAMARITEPALDRVFPKKVDAGMMATQVVIQLTESQVRGTRADYTAPPLLVSEVPASSDDTDPPATS